MHVKNSCKYFSRKKTQLIDMNKINQNILREPSCDLNKLSKHSCPDDCKWIEKNKIPRGYKKTCEIRAAPL